LKKKEEDNAQGLELTFIFNRPCAEKANHGHQPQIAAS
jgi:hypothetical protein